MTRRMLLLAASILCWAAVILPASAQHFTQIPGSLAQIAAGRSEVWGLDPSNAVYRFSASSKTFARVGTIKLSRIAVGGGSAFQTDQVWGVTASGKVYRYNDAKNAFSQIPGTLLQIVVGEGDALNILGFPCHPHEVWGINAAEQIYRYNYCTSQFDQIPGSLTKIATGGGEVWGLNGSAQIYNYNFVASQFIQVPGSLQQITVGASDVWGLDGVGNIYRFDNSSGEFVESRGGSDWQIAAGGDGAWGYHRDDDSGTNAIWRLHSSSCFCTANDSEFPMTVSRIAVGYGAGVWALNSSHQIFAFVRP